jgi:hypothetical protein
MKTSKNFEKYTNKIVKKSNSQMKLKKGSRFLKSLLKKIDSQFIDYFIGCQHKSISTIDLKTHSEIEDDGDVEVDVNNNVENSGSLELNKSTIESISKIMEATNELIVETRNKIIQVKEELLKTIENSQMEFEDQAGT